MSSPTASLGFGSIPHPGLRTRNTPDLTARFIVTPEGRRTCRSGPGASRAVRAGEGPPYPRRARHSPPAGRRSPAPRSGRFRPWAYRARNRRRHGGNTRVRTRVLIGRRSIAPDALRRLRGNGAYVVRRGPRRTNRPCSRFLCTLPVTRGLSGQRHRGWHDPRPHARLPGRSAWLSCAAVYVSGCHRARFLPSPCLRPARLASPCPAESAGR